MEPTSVTFCLEAVRLCAAESRVCSSRLAGLAGCDRRNEQWECPEAWGLRTALQAMAAGKALHLSLDFANGPQDTLLNVCGKRSSDDSAQAQRCARISWNLLIIQTSGAGDGIGAPDDVGALSQYSEYCKPISSTFRGMHN